ncbi:MAG: hypothetical protein KDJ65_30880 [Anaerolineae bacterium]|nr:hypothetical protein [Anaerolineae bacterium]
MFAYHLWQQGEPVSLWYIVFAFLNSNAKAFSTALESPNRNMLVLQVVTVAGFSDAVGQSVVLFANRVAPLRFVISVLISMLLFVLGYVVWVLSLWLVADVVFDHRVALWRAGAAVGLSYVPLMLSFLALMPYFGSSILRLLNIWAAMALVNILRFSFDFIWLEAALCAAIGLAFIFILRLTIGRPVLWLTLRLRNVAAGKKLQLDLSKLFYTDESNDSRGE